MWKQTKNNRLRKKGNVTDGVEAVAIVLTIVITLFIMFTINNKFYTNSQNIPTINDSGHVEFVNTYNVKFTQAWDYVFVFLLVVFPIFSFIAAKFIPSDISNMMLIYFVLGILVIISMIVSNIYGQFMDNPDFQTFTEQTPYMSFMMPKLPYYMMFYILVVSIALYAKKAGFIR